MLSDSSVSTSFNLSIIFDYFHVPSTQPTGGELFDTVMQED
jgi:hypothetical protein